MNADSRIHLERKYLICSLFVFQDILPVPERFLNAILCTSNTRIFIFCEGVDKKDRRQTDREEGKLERLERE